jgi:predicted secreted hydrolase
VFGFGCKHPLKIAVSWTKKAGPSHYLEGNIEVDQHGRPVRCRITDLSWKGHEFLGLARDNEGWAWAKKSLSGKALSVSMSVLTRALEAYTLLQLGIK